MTSQGIRRLSGPKKLPLFGNLHQIRPTEFHLQLMDWCDRYGSPYSFYIGRKKFVVVATYHWIHEILRKRPESFRRMSAMETVFREISPTGLFTSEGEDWRRQRKLTMPAFHNAHLKQFFDTLLRITNRLEKRWIKSAAASVEVDICKDLMRFTVDVTTNLAFAYDMNTLEHEEDLIQKEIEVVFPAFARRVNAFFPYWRYIKLPRDRAVDRAMKKLRNKMDEIVLAHRSGAASSEEGKHRPSRNLLEALVRARDSGTSEPHTGLSDDELFGNIFTILVAGEDTTANSLAWAIHFLLENPEWQTCLQDEADQSWKESGFRYEDIDKLKYTEAVVLESMRLKPVAPFLFLEANEDFSTEELFVPKGTNLTVLLNHGAIQESNFTKAKEFHPKRWLPDLRPEGWNHNMKAFLPFGSGTRICPGKSLAMLEMKVILAMLSRLFVLKKLEGRKPVRDHFAFVSKPANLWAKLELRKTRVSAN